MVVRMFKIIMFIVILFLLVVGFYHLHKALPENISYESEVYKLDSSSVNFLVDETYLDKEGNRKMEQEIFDEVFRMIDEAEHYILLDFFLYNDFMGTSENPPHRALSKELTNRLLAKKEAEPEIVIQFITDPINSIYGGYPVQDFELLRSAGVSVIVTDLTTLRDSNPVYSSVWRTFFQWLGNDNKSGYLPNPFDVNGKKLSLRTYLAILNYKANHRKIILADYQDGSDIGLATLVTSANPHDGSSAHRNTAIKINSQIWKDTLKSEAVVAELSGHTFIYPDKEFIDNIKEPSKGNLEVQLLTESKIKTKILDNIASLQKGNQLDMAMFYISDRDIVEALREADKRGVKLRLLLDPNKDAFGREKNGIPNRQVAHELVSNSAGNTTVRWCHTSGEQCHSKLLLFDKGEEVSLLQGSANLTRRNLDDFNLETNVLVNGPATEAIFEEAYNLFNKQWNNEQERIYSVEYAEYRDTSRFKTAVYRFKEYSGISRW